MDYLASPLQPFGVAVAAVEKGTSVREVAVAELRQLFNAHQLVLLRGFTPFTDKEDFTRYCQLWGAISVWPFGNVLELVEHAKPADHIFDHSYVPLHWDGMYRPQVPEFQIFNCVSAPLAGQGGRTTFANTVLALQHATPEHRSLWRRAVGRYTRKMEFYASTAESPVVTSHPHRGYEVLRYNEPPAEGRGRFVNPPQIRFAGIADHELPDLHQSLQDALYHPANYYAHSWQSGDVVIADNLSLLHGRERFVSGSPRHLQRVHVLSDPPYTNPALRAYE